VQIHPKYCCLQQTCVLKEASIGVVFPEKRDVYSPLYLNGFPPKILLNPSS
jgi:hypothetical protein